MVDENGPIAARGLSASVVGLGRFVLMPGDLGAARKRPGTAPEGWPGVPASLLRASDEQTVSGVAATFEAIAKMGRSPGDFADWGVVSASRFLGRAYVGTVLRSFAAEGVWGVSPHLIPHYAMHSASGTISLAMGSHGPNLGVGGGRHSEFEGFLAALTWLSIGLVPGVWLVLGGWEPELVPGRPPGECRSLALGLTKARTGRPGFQLVAGASTGVDGPMDLAMWGERLADEPKDEAPTTIATDPSGSFRVEWSPSGFDPGEA